MSSQTCAHPGALPQQATPPATPAAKPFLTDVAAELRRIYAQLVFIR